jgi:hypothetical protein
LEACKPIEADLSIIEGVEVDGRGCCNNLADKGFANIVFKRKVVRRNEGHMIDFSNPIVNSSTSIGLEASCHMPVQTDKPV